MASTSGGQLQQNHRIFLSHSGHQKDFVRTLFHDLTEVGYSPFFDECPDSLPKGEQFPPRIFDAARTCELAVVVLSEDFVTNPWPMMELDEFVKSKRRILPLFYKLRPRDLSDSANFGRWKLKWQNFKRISTTDCEDALKEVRKYNGEEKRDSITEEAYRKKVVESICRAVPVPPRYYVADVQGKDRLCRVIQDRFDKISESCCRFPRASVLGISGLGGSGKTTICQIMCNHYAPEFLGRVCHIELAMPMDVCRITNIEVLKKALKWLTQAEQPLLDSLSDERSAQAELEKRIRQKAQKVFLAVDNVWRKNQDLVRVFLNLPFPTGSRILVTSRSGDLLRGLLKDCKEDCFLYMPSLQEDEAVGILAYNAGGGFPRGYDPHEIQFFHKLVGKWKVRVGEASEVNHPLMLKVIGSRLKILNGGLRVWKADGLLSEAGRFKTLGMDSEALISMLRISYDSLPNEHYKLVFLDVTLFLPKEDMRVSEVCKWLSGVHSEWSYKEIKKWLKEMSTYALLEFEKYETGGKTVKVHDLYKEFAQMEAKNKQYDSLWCVNNEPVAHRMGKLERFVLTGTRWELQEVRLNWSWQQVKVLWLGHCWVSEELDLSRMRSLECLDLIYVGGCENITGLFNLNLVRLRIHGDWSGKINFGGNLELLSSLQTLELWDVELDLKKLALDRLQELQELILIDVPYLRTLVLSDRLPKLRKLTIWGLPGLSLLPSLNSCLAEKLSNLEKLTLESFDSVEELTLSTSNLTMLTLSDFTNLRKVHFSASKLTRLVARECPLLEELVFPISEELEGLCVAGCHTLKTLVVGCDPKVPLVEEECNLSCSKLTRLQLHQCTRLTKVKGSATNLKGLVLLYCTGLEELDFPSLGKLEMGYVFDCLRLSKFPQFPPIVRQWDLGLTSNCPNPSKSQAPAFHSPH